MMSVTLPAPNGTTMVHALARIIALREGRAAGCGKRREPDQQAANAFHLPLLVF